MEGCPVMQPSTGCATCFCGGCIADTDYDRRFLRQTQEAAFCVGGQHCDGHDSANRQLAIWEH
jgi:hypothetical protein